RQNLPEACTRGRSSRSMKNKTRYLCQECAFGSPKWLGRCPNCGSWNCFVEERVQDEPKVQSNSLAALREEFRATRVDAEASVEAALDDLPHRDRTGIGLGGGGGWVELSDEKEGAPKPSLARHVRIDTGVGELNRVLGGGLVS